MALPTGATEPDDLVEPVLSGDGTGNRVALTFDEHYGGNTLRIGSYLESAGVKATFFTVGVDAHQYPRLAPGLLAAGHELGNHSWNHPNLVLTNDAGYNQYRLTQAVIQAQTGFKTALARPPFGRVSPAVIDSAARLDMITVKWSLTPNPIWGDEKQIANFILSRVKAGDIILMHQNDPCRKAVPRVLMGLAAKGLSSVRVTDLLDGAYTGGSFP